MFSTVPTSPVCIGYDSLKGCSVIDKLIAGSVQLLDFKDHVECSVFSGIVQLLNARTALLS